MAKIHFDGRRVYSDHNEASENGCFNCGKPLSAATLREREGDYAMSCPDCRMSTFYTLEVAS